MKKYLPNVLGFEIGNIPYSLDWIGDLLYFDWPIISVLRGEDNKPFVKAWLESYENITRYAIFEISKHLLEEYIFGICSYLDVISNPTNDLFFIVDTNSKGDVVSTKLTASSYFPKKYRPKKHVLFDHDDTVNLQNIIEVFSLETVRTEEPYTFDILKEANEVDSELINIHLASSNGKVGYGRIQSQILGEILVNYNKIAEATALNVFDNSDTSNSRKKIRHKKDGIEYVRKLAATEYSYEKAASFSLFLKPVKIVEDKETDKSSTEKIAENMFNLFKAGFNLIELEQFSTSFSPAMLNSFSNLLRTVRDNDLTLTVQYGNPKKNSSQREFFNYRKSERILENLSSFEKGEPIENKLKGTFTALDKVNHTFRFLSDDKQSFEGRFDKTMTDYVYRLNLIDSYEIGLTSVWERKSGRFNGKSRYTITFCYKISSDA